MWPNFPPIHPVLCLYGVQQNQSRSRQMVCVGECCSLPPKQAPAVPPLFPSSRLNLVTSPTPSSRAPNHKGTFATFSKDRVSEENFRIYKSVPGEPSPVKISVRSDGKIPAIITTKFYYTLICIRHYVK